MGKKDSKSSRDLGLEAASICGEYFFKLKYLHYGLWENGLEQHISNLHIAQDRYTDFLISHIPDDAKNVLDVGCGTGMVARTLIDKRYHVDCVSPSEFLSERARRILPEETTIYQCKFEDLATDKRYDVVMFSESFQYINLEQALEQVITLLNDGGCLLISDAFKKDITKKGVGGGHQLSRFFEMISKYPFEQIVHKDITELTAPNIRMLDEATQTVGVPLVNAAVEYAEEKYPTITKLVKWKYRKKIEKMHKKYTSDKRSVDDFVKYKTYRLFLYRKKVN
jgi:SAM-dependent methyltransferase